MSLTLLMQPSTDDSLSILIKKPQLIRKIIVNNDTLICDTVRTRGQSIGNVFDQLIKSTGISGLLKKSRLPDAENLSSSTEQEHDWVSLDTAWHAIHYMLSGNVFDGTFPMDFLLFGGQDIGTIDVGFGPARAVFSSEVKEIHNFLSGLPTDVFMTAYDADALCKEKIYPEIWYRFYADDENRAFIRDNYEIMKYTVSRAAEKNDGLLLWVSSRSVCVEPVSSKVAV